MPVLNRSVLKIQSNSGVFISHFHCPNVRHRSTACLVWFRKVVASQPSSASLVSSLNKTKTLQFNFRHSEELYRNDVSSNVF